MQQNSPHHGAVRADTPPPALDPRGIALFLDLDGTLAEIAPRPDQARIPTEMLATLQRLRDRLDGALALVSGRELAAIDRLCAPHRFAAAGQHGLEHRVADGAVPHARTGRSAMERIEREVAAFHAHYPPLLVEYKGLATAMHYRGAPGLGSEVRDFMRALARRHAETELLEGKMVCEIRLKGGGKGEAIHRFMEMPPFAGRIPVFLGDDATDEEGFAAVNEADGISVKIGEGATTARHRLPDTQAVAAWLGALAATPDAEEAA